MQLLFTVLIPVWPVKLTLLKVTALQDKVAAEPSKVIVPLFALNVGEPEIVKAPATVILELGAVNVPPEIVRSAFKSALVGSKIEPEVMNNCPEVEKLE